MNFLKKTWKGILIAAGVLVSAAFYVSEPAEEEGKPQEEVFLLPDRSMSETGISAENEDAFPEELSAGVPGRDELKELMKEAVGEVLSEGLRNGELRELTEELAEQTVREALQKELTSLSESGTLTDAIGKYLEVQSGLIHINHADTEELKTLPGIGEAKARAIVSYREKNGDFQSVEELKNVEGISENLLEKIREEIDL